MSVAVADHEGLPFIESFDTAHLSDAAATTADWGASTPGLLLMPSAEPLTAPFDPVANGENVGTTAHTTRALALADMNGDGSLDLVEGADGTNGVYLNDNGSFPTRIPVTTDNGNTRGIAVGDVDSDGDLDIVAGNYNSRSRVYLNAGDGVQYTAADVTSVPYPVDSIALADLNGDGHLDAVAAIHWNTARHIFYNTGNPAAPFGAAGVEGTPLGDADYSQEVLVGDLDNDGDTDVVFINQERFNRMYLNDGAGGFVESRIGVEADNSQAGALGDLNGDGFLDLVVGNYPPGAINRIYFNSGDPGAPFSAGTVPVDFTLPNDPSFVHEVTLGDVDNDGDLDILLSTAGIDEPEVNITRFTNRIYLNDGAGGFSSSMDVSADMDVTNTSVIGDVDGDGRLDIVAGNEDRDAENNAFAAMNRLIRNIGQPSGQPAALQLKARATSTRVDTETDPIATIALDAGFDPLGLHNQAEFWVSSNGGVDWLHAVPGGAPVVIPEGIRGNDLRWRVELSSLSPSAFGAAALALDTVMLAANAPTFTSTPITEATAEMVYTYDVTTSDPEAGDVLTLAAPTAPSWLTLNTNGDGTGTLTGTPTAADVGQHRVTLEVTDAAGASTTQTFTITVAAAGEPPAFTSTPVTEATTDVEYVYAVTAADPAAEAVTLSAPTLPTWLEFVDNLDGTGTLSGTPDATAVGEHAVELQATDASGFTATQLFAVTVTEGAVNGAPSFVSDPVATATAETAYSYDIEATDPDAGDVLVVTAPTAPAWLAIVDNGDGTASLAGTPGAGDVGDHPVVLQVADAAGATAQQAFTITVAAPPAAENSAPSFASEPVTAATADSAYSYDVAASDPDAGDVLAITAPTVPSWLTITDQGDGTATLAGTPGAGAVGDHAVVLMVTDAAGATAEQSFTVTVAQAPSEPSNPPPSSPTPSSGGGGGSSGLLELIGLAGLALLIRRRRRES